MSPNLDLNVMNESGDEAVRLHEQAIAARESGDLQQAAVLGQEALRRFELLDGPDHPDVANVLLHLGDVHEAGADYDQAQGCFQRAVHIMEALPTGDPDLDRLRLRALGGLAGIHRQLGTYREAECLYQRALEADHNRRFLWRLLLAVGLLLVWIGWFFSAEVTLYEVTAEAQLEVGQTAYPVMAPVAGSVETTQLALDEPVVAGGVLVRLDAHTQRLQREEEVAVDLGLEAPEEKEVDTTQDPALSGDVGVELELQGVSVQAGGHTILEALDLSVEAGCHVAIVGPSGAGECPCPAVCPLDTGLVDGGPRRPREPTGDGLAAGFSRPGEADHRSSPPDRGSAFLAASGLP